MKRSRGFFKSPGSQKAVGRQFLTGKLGLEDVRHPNAGDMPRFAPQTYADTLKLLTDYVGIADRLGCSPAQLALAWVLSRGDHVVAIPGTTNNDHLAENAGGCEIELDGETLAQLDAIINPQTVKGHRYSEARRADIDTEDFV